MGILVYGSPEHKPSLWDWDPKRVDSRFQGLLRGLIAGGDTQDPGLHEFVTGDTPIDFGGSIAESSYGRVIGVTEFTRGPRYSEIGGRSGDIGSLSGFILFKASDLRTAENQLINISANSHIKLEWIGGANAEVRFSNHHTPNTISSGADTAPANEWHTAAATIRDAADAHGYLNGVDFGSFTPDPHDWGTLGIGDWHSANWLPLNGEIAVWYLWDRE